MGRTAIGGLGIIVFHVSRKEGSQTQWEELERPPSWQCVDGDHSGHTLTKEECALGQCDVACVLLSHGMLHLEISLGARL